MRRRSPHHSDGPDAPAGSGATGRGASSADDAGDPSNPAGIPGDTRGRGRSSSRSGSSASSGTGSASGSGSASGERKRDRRSTRWDEHRRARRDELTAATIAAIREHGADVGMTQVAARARTSKTVVYRHFADKTDLYLAVCDRVAGFLISQLQEAMRAAGLPQETLHAGIDAYLALIESDPDVYRYVMRPPSLERREDTTDPVTDLCSVIGDHIAEIITIELRRQNRDPSPAVTWGHALVGMVRSAGDQWLAQRPELPRSVLADHLADLAWAGLSRTVTRSAASSAS